MAGRRIAWGLWALTACRGDGEDGPAPGVDTDDTDDTRDTDDTDDTDLPPGPVEVSLGREPAAGPDPILVTVRIPNAPDDTPVSVRADGVDVDVAAAGEGVFEARVVPSADGVEVALEVDALGAQVARTALVLPALDDRWGQPESVPGVVNTPAYEDSSEVSPDGQWLVVSNYSPVDLISCFASAPPGEPAPPTAPACNRILGPYTAPDRPDLPGADRILALDDIDHRIPDLGLVGPGGEEFPAALPPVAAYGFHLQPDGAMGAPFVIAYDADGFPDAPFGVHFLDVGADGTATVTYGWNDPSTPDLDADLYSATITLGVANTLGVISLDALGYHVDPPTDRLPLVDLAGVQSNPFVADDGVYFDQHAPGVAEYDVWFAAGTADTSFAVAEPAGVSRPGRPEYQPFEHGDRLFYATGEFDTIRSSPRAGADPTLVASWGEERVELGVLPAGGSIVSVGEPSVGVVDGVEWLYFVYGSITAEGVDVDIARVPSVTGTR